MIITAHAHARAGLVGNPSDGYFGKTISFIIRNYKATVHLWESPHFEIVPTHGDLARFDSVNAFLRDQRLHGYDGDTGAVIYAGGGSNELMTGTRQWNTGIAARGHIYFGADNKVYAFNLPGGTPTPTPTATPGPIQVRGQGKKVGGINTSRLKWRGATSANVDVYRDGNVIATTPNDGSYDDSTGTTGQASFTYKVCEAGTQTCSNTVTVNFGP